MTDKCKATTHLLKLKCGLWRVDGRRRRPINGGWLEFCVREFGCVVVVVEFGGKKLVGWKLVGMLLLAGWLERERRRGQSWSAVTR